MTNGTTIPAYQTQKLMNNPIEKCVSCNATTPYNFNDNIYFRNFYVEGSGQLCESCYISIYAKA